MRELSSRSSCRVGSKSECRLVWFKSLRLGRRGRRFESCHSDQKNLWSSVVANVEKKRAKIQARIAELESGMKLALQKKASGTTAIDVPGITRQIAQLRQELAALK